MKSTLQKRNIRSRSYRLQLLYRTQRSDHHSSFKFYGMAKRRVVQGKLGHCKEHIIKNAMTDELFTKPTTIAMKLDLTNNFIL